MANQQTAPRIHWTESQTWKNRTTGEVKTARAILDAHRRELIGVSLCCATFSIHVAGASWDRIS